MTGLNLKEATAIEYKYKGASHKDIASHIDMPKQTVDEWFKKRGRLSPYFQLYSEDMNAFRQKQTERLMADIDREILIVIRLFFNRFAEVLQHGCKKPLIQNDEVVLDEHGDVCYYREWYMPKMKDVVQFWKIQRVTENKPTDIKETRCPICKRKTHEVYRRV